MTQINDAWSFTGTSLQGTNWNIRILSPSEQVPARRGENIAIPSRDGRTYRPKTFEQRIVSLAMFVKGTGGSALERDLETLKAILGQPGQGVLSRTVAGRTAAWNVNAEVANVVEFTPASDTMYNAVVEFLCADPFWTGALASAATVDIASSPHTFTATNNGTAANERGTITILGAITDPKIQIGDIWVKYSGTVTAGGTLIIDCNNYTAAKGTADVTGSITHGGAAAWMRLLPGANTVTVTGSGLTAPDVTLTFSELWL